MGSKPFGNLVSAPSGSQNKSDHRPIRSAISKSYNFSFVRLLIIEFLVASYSKTRRVIIMLAASMCRDIHFSVLPSNLSSTVPRCLFGSPNAKDTVDLLQEALDMERSKFARRWGVDPRNEDKENFTNFKNKSERIDKSPRKRAAPYSRQSSIHGKKLRDYHSLPKFYQRTNEEEPIICIELPAQAMT